MRPETAWHLAWASAKSSVLSGLRAVAKSKVSLCTCWSSHRHMRNRDELKLHVEEDTLLSTGKREQHLVLPERD